MKIKNNNSPNNTTVIIIITINISNNTINISICCNSNPGSLKGSVISYP